MTDVRVLKIEDIHFDYVATCVEGTAVCRSGDGPVLRRRVAILASDYWTQETAARALEQAASDIL